MVATWEQGAEAHTTGSTLTAALPKPPAFHTTYHQTIHAKTPENTEHSTSSTCQHHVSIEYRGSQGYLVRPGLGRGESPDSKLEDVQVLWFCQILLTVLGVLAHLCPSFSASLPLGLLCVKG